MEPASRRASWDERHAAADPIEHHDPDPTLVEVAEALPAGRALDLGSGDGRNAIWLARAGWRVTAADFSRVALERAAARAATAGVEVDWRLEDLLAWRPEPLAFDLVALMFIHLPVDELAVVRAAAAEAVAPGGTLLVVGHDRSNLDAGVGGPQHPGVLYTPAEIAAGLPPFLRVERSEVVRRGAGERVPLDAVVVARREA